MNKYQEIIISCSIFRLFHVNWNLTAVHKDFIGKYVKFQRLDNCVLKASLNTAY